MSSLLLPLVFDSREHLTTRSVALRVLATHGQRLSGPELTRLLELPLSHMCPCCRPPLESVLTLAQTEDAWAAAEAALQEVSPHERTSVLTATETTPLPSPLVEWLYTRWYSCDRHQLAAEGPRGSEANLKVALAHRERPEAGMLLDEWLRDMATQELEWLEFRIMSAEELARLVRANPQLQQCAADLLRLPLPDLLAHFGQEVLLRRLRRIARAESVAQTVSYRIMRSPPGFSRAVKLLVEWRDARPLLCSLLCDFNIAEGVRRALLDHLLDHDRDMVVRWTLVAARYPDNAPLVRFVLRRAAQEPELGDRPLFLAALRGTDDEARASALEGLFALGETGAGWCDRLTSLVHSNHARVRLRAAACLAREGKREWLPLVQQTALDPSEPRLRAEAVRWLAHVDADASRPVLRKVLAEDELRPSRQRIAELNEAAWALSRLGSTEDLSALLDASVRSWGSPMMDRALECHLARQEGRPAEDIPPPIPNWEEYDAVTS
ncbi:HEAT repeat domain-containing protein [Myxococcus sp. RHSTA-1-4]|uniref:HEAT repeat domain-containing protein n=1 Tax=Myxococcus sp. RHSTA-1-4 TaxID=2874601 RepID=UPI001CBA820D|nr:HEAT repeat domain-containing protein [Myxococcus sp. RHSTA-1-4]MBZ4416498.1 HEAT repeat domain-containing protein [Myxococcus sp. RHSTA-1-4]